MARAEPMPFPAGVSFWHWWLGTQASGSLRDIESALMNDSSLRYHLDTGSVSRSALARGNKKLNADFF
ncbi:MAG: hypothetical protein R6U98_18430 [Pirellulaceae bacterium]